MTHLFMVGLGPVQDFIAAARRSRDLWFGSWVLSELSRAAARAIAEAEGVDALIFPAPQEGEDLWPGAALAVANKLLAQVEGDPAALGSAVEAAVTDRLSALRRQVFTDKGLDRPKVLRDADAARAQIEDLPEIAWAALPLAPGSDYAQARQRLTRLLEAVKATRAFRRSTWGAPVPKSSLDGQRESVIPEDAVRASITTQDAAQRAFNDYGITAGERLCGVGLLKRHGRPDSDGAGEAQRDHLMFSTAHFAALPIIERARRRRDEAPTLQAGWDAFREALNRAQIPGEQLLPASARGAVAKDPDLGEFDGRVLFSARYPEILGIGADPGDPQRLKDAQGALRRFLTDVAGLSGEPNPYYALLMADGDHIGQLLGAQRDASAHRRASQALAAFARRAREVVEGHGGRLVYSGGDDVLAFLPLHEALACVDGLQRAFSDALREIPSPVPPTLSSGLVIAHFLEPLADVLAHARAAERGAKSVPDKGGLAVRVVKRGGGDREVKGPHDEVRGRLGTLVEAHIGDALPDGFAHELEDRVIHLLGPSGAATPSEEQSGALREILGLEARRILGRKRAEGGTIAVGEELAQRLDGLIAGSCQGETPLRDLIDALLIAGDLARAVRQAAPEPARPIVPPMLEAS